MDISSYLFPGDQSFKAYTYTHMHLHMCVCVYIYATLNYCGKLAESKKY